MNLRRPRPAQRAAPGIGQRVFGPGAATAFALWYVSSSVEELGAILVPATHLSTLVLCVILYTRIRTRKRSEAAWELYARLDLARNSFESVQRKRTLSLTGMN